MFMKKNIQLEITHSHAFNQSSPLQAAKVFIKKKKGKYCIQHALFDTIRVKYTGNI